MKFTMMTISTVFDCKDTFVDERLKFTNTRLQNLPKLALAISTYETRNVDEQKKKKNKNKKKRRK